MCTRSVSPLICPRTLELLPPFGFVNNAEYWCRRICSSPAFTSSGRGGDLLDQVVVLCEPPRAPRPVSSGRTGDVPTSSAEVPVSSFLPPCRTCCVTVVLPDPSPNEQGCGASFQVLAGPLHSFSGEVSTQVLCPFLNLLLFWGVAELQFCLRVLDAKLFPGIGFVETFSPIPHAASHPR